MTALTSADWRNDRAPDCNHMQVAIFECERIGFYLELHYWQSQEHLVGRLFQWLVKMGRRLA